MEPPLWRVAGAQLAVRNDVAANVTALLGAVGAAAAAGATLLVTPEGALSGYRPDFDPTEVRNGLETVTAAAREADLALALGTCFVEEDGRCYNQVRLYSRSGEYLGFHSKILRCGTVAGEPVRGEINDYATTPLRTFFLEGTCVGALICNDYWANPECTPMPDPHLTQELARRGARVILHAVHGGRNGGPWSAVARQYHEANLRMRARAGRLWVVTVDSAYPVELPASSPSGVISPAGEWVVRAPERGEHLFLCEVKPG